MMVASVQQSVDKLSIEDVEKYLSAKGWSKVATPNPHALVYAGPEDIYGEPITVVLPASKMLYDASDRLTQTIHTVAKIEGRSAVQLLSSIARLNRFSGAIMKRPAKRRKLTVNP